MLKNKHDSKQTLISPDWMLTGINTDRMFHQTISDQHVQSEEPFNQHPYLPSGKLLQ